MTQEHLQRCFNNLELQIVGMWLAGPHCTVLLWPGMQNLPSCCLRQVAEDAWCDIEGSTALLLAVYHGHVDIVSLCIEAGFDTNLASADRGETPLYLAARATPLYIAAENDHLEVARLLVQAEADVNKSTSDDGTAPLYMAAQEGYVEVVHFLIKAGADIDTTRKAGAGGVTASYIAAEYGHLEVVRLPVQAGADVDKTTDDGATPCT